MALTPLKNHYFDIGDNDTNPVSNFMLSLITDEDQLSLRIANRSDFVLNVILWFCIFIVVFIILLLLSVYMFIKIANRSLEPIKTLNYKVSTLVQNNGNLSLDHTSGPMASIDIQKMYEAFSGMITTKRFSNNNMFDKNDALAIMDYAEVITVLKDNIKAKGI